MNDPELQTGADEAVTRSADLNERLLLEAMAGSAPGGRAADDGAGAPAVPDTGPITARAAPGTRTPPIGRPEAISPQAPPARTDQAPRTRTDQAVTARPAPPPRAAPASALVPARLTAPVPPVYPSRCESRADDEEAVTVRFNVSRFGKVTSPSVTNSTNKCFDRAALAAVARFGFDAARRDGRPVPENGRTTRVVFRKP